MFQYPNEIAKFGLLFSFAFIIAASASELFNPGDPERNKTTLKVVVSCALLAAACVYILKVF